MIIHLGMFCLTLSMSPQMILNPFAQGAWQHLFKGTLILLSAHSLTDVQPPLEMIIYCHIIHLQVTVFQQKNTDVQWVTKLSWILEQLHRHLVFEHLNEGQVTRRSWRTFHTHTALRIRPLQMHHHPYYQNTVRDYMLLEGRWAWERQETGSESEGVHIWTSVKSLRYE